MTSLEYWLWLTLAFGPANPKKWNAVARYGDVESAYENLSSGNFEGIMPSDRKLVKAADPERTESLISLCEQKGIKICVPGDGLYPKRLLDLYNPPSALFYTGDISGIDESLVIASVGTRQPSEYSVEVGQRLISELVGYGVRIASGFQTGLDSLSHRVAMKSGGLTYAVLPCGHLYGYPKENAGAKTIVAAHGAVISEYFPHDAPNSAMFRARNRILSGISCGTLVLQAGRTSGALSTASFSVAQGKEVFCVSPHDIYSEDYEGAAELIRTGAVPVFGCIDILQTYRSSFPNIYKLCEADEYGADDGETPEKPRVSHKKAASKRKPIIREDTVPEELIKVPTVPYEELSGTKKEIIDYIGSRGSVFIDEISVGLGDVAEIEAILTELELDGMIESLPGNRFGLAGKSRKNI